MTRDSCHPTDWRVKHTTPPFSAAYLSDPVADEAHRLRGGGVPARPEAERAWSAWDLAENGKGRLRAAPSWNNRLD